MVDSTGRTILQTVAPKLLRSTVLVLVLAQYSTCQQSAPARKSFGCHSRVEINVVYVHSSGRILGGWAPWAPWSRHLWWFYISVTSAYLAYFVTDLDLYLQ